jgi:hypothetical protein
MDSSERQRGKQENCNRGHRIDPPFSDLLLLECHEQEVKPARAATEHYLAAIASRSPTCWRHIA